MFRDPVRTLYPSSCQPYLINWPGTSIRNLRDERKGSVLWLDIQQCC